MVLERFLPARSHTHYYYCIFLCKVFVWTCLRRAQVQAETCSVHVMVTKRVTINLCCVTLNKCGNKYKQMASIQKATKATLLQNTGHLIESQIYPTVFRATSKKASHTHTDLDSDTCDHNIYLCLFFTTLSAAGVAQLV